MGYIEPIDNRACFFRNNGFTEAVELGQRSVYIHNLVRMKMMEYMREVNTFTYCNRNFVNLRFSLQKCISIMDAFNMQNN